MKNKFLWSSFCFLIVVLLSNSFIHKFGLLNFRQRKCVSYKPLQFEVTFSDRQKCLQSPEPALDEFNLNTVDEINFRGYNASIHTILSKDGYYSELHRISGGLQSPPKIGKKAVLIFHGLTASGKSWIIQPENRNLAFTLADAGYEVWLANLRGSSSSQRHTHLDPEKDLEFWDFGAKEICTLDLPLYIDLMRKETGTDQIYFACHSMGCALFLAALSDLPELNGKFKAAFFLAPTVYFHSTYNPSFLLFPPIIGTPFENLLFRLLEGKMKCTPSALATALNLTPDKICSWKYVRCGICDNFLFFMYGPAQLNYTDLPNILKKLQDDSSLRLIYHGLQIFEKCDVPKYNYGIDRNLLEYGSLEPPSYNFSQVPVPIHIFYAEKDNFATPVGVRKTREAIPKEYRKTFHKVDWPLFTHIDFLMAKDADILVYHKVRDIMNQLEAN